MKRLEEWLRHARLRQCKIWWHDRYDVPGDPPRTPELWWHVELSEHSFPMRDYGQRQQAGAWMKQEIVFTGYDKSLSAAVAKALRKAKDGTGFKAFSG